MKNFELISKFSPSNDQQKAIDDIVNSILKGNKYQTLLGVTGNQPEAYIPRQDLFIEKDSSINDELERLRLSTTANLLSFDDVITVASVSANYGLGNPAEYQGMVMFLENGFKISQKDMLIKLVEMGYTRNDNFFDRGNFRVNGDVIDIYPAYFNDEAVRIEFFGDEIDEIYHFDFLENKRTKTINKFILYPASQFIVGQNRLKEAIKGIEIELDERLKFFKDTGKLVEAQRLKQRVEFDLEMLRATGSTKGVENYSRYITGMKPGGTPYSMFDYYEIKNKDYLVIVDESHVSLPQFRGMYAGDKSRKDTLVEYGFRLPSALDNRPLKFEEFINKKGKFLFVSATPNDLEIELSKGKVFYQILRPTGLLDPEIILKDSDNQVEILYDMAKDVIAKNERVLVTVLTKKMAEELTKYYLELGIKVKYMHSDIDAIQRNELIRGLRQGKFDMLIGINLLREGLDLPEVSLIAIMDADKEGFLRSRTSLIQTMGRAARNVNGKVVMFYKKITNSMKEAIDITTQRRKYQDEYNKKNGITPHSATRNLEDSLKIEDEAEILRASKNLEKMPASERAKIIKELRKQMLEAASNLEFEKAANLRDEIAKMKEI